MIMRNEIDHCFGRRVRCLRLLVAGELVRRRCRQVGAAAKPAKPNADWAQWGGSPMRNNTPDGHNIPTEWNIGEFDYRTGAWDTPKARRTSSGSPSSARRPTATPSSPTARSTSAPTTAAAGSSAIRPTVDLGVPALLRHQGRQVPLAAQQRKAAHRPRARLAAAGHLLRAARRRRPAVVRHQPRRSPLPRHRRLPRRRERRPLQGRSDHGTRTKPTSSGSST